MGYCVKALDSEQLFEISELQWQKNQQQYELLLRYLAVLLQEQAQQLWLAVESFDNLAACETFAFLSGKQIEPVAIGQTALKQLLQQLQPGTATNQVQESQLHSYQQMILSQNRMKLRKLMHKSRLFNYSINYWNQVCNIPFLIFILSRYVRSSRSALELTAYYNGIRY